MPSVTSTLDDASALALSFARARRHELATLHLRPAAAADRRAAVRAPAGRVPSRSTPDAARRRAAVSATITG